MIYHGVHPRNLLYKILLSSRAQKSDKYARVCIRKKNIKMQEKKSNITSSSWSVSPHWTQLHQSPAMNPRQVVTRACYSHNFHIRWRQGWRLIRQQGQWDVAVHAAPPACSVVRATLIISISGRMKPRSGRIAVEGRTTPAPAAVPALPRPRRGDEWCLLLCMRCLIGFVLLMHRHQPFGS